jgi:hypothetical protein
MGRRIDFDLSNFGRGQLYVLIGAGLLIVAAVVGLILLLTGSPGGAEPAAEATVVATGVPDTPTPTPSPPPSSTPPPPETPTPAETPTLEPYSYQVQEGETLYYIIQLFGYRDLAVVPEILELNDMADENDLFAGETLLIPRQTPTPGLSATETATPNAEEVTETPAPGTGTAEPDESAEAEQQTPGVGCGYEPEQRCISPDGGFWLHEVQEGETCAGLARAYDTTVPDVLNDNNLTDDCIIAPGAILRIRIKVTLTPTLTPTGGPDSTATPTPPPAPPLLIAPANGASIPRGDDVVLQWAASQLLPEGASYRVEVRNTETDEALRAVTRSNAYRLPSDLRPSSGSIRYSWQVAVIDGDDADAPVLGGPGETWTFTWGG